MNPGVIWPTVHFRATRPVHALILAGTMVVVCLAAAACATQSVLHLKQEPWSLDEPQSMRTNYLRFDFLCSQGREGLRVQGSASPLPDGPIPDWAVWARDLWLGAYLSDRTGQVLAQEVKVLQPQHLTRAHPISFSFVLEPHSMGEPGPVYISFGYRLVLASGPADQPEKKDGPPGAKSPVFFASESALTRF